MNLFTTIERVTMNKKSKKQSINKQIKTIRKKIKEQQSNGSKKNK